MQKGTREPLRYKNQSSWGGMKDKNDRKPASNKRPYIGPQVTVLNPDSDQAKGLAGGLAGALAGSSPAKCEEIVPTLKSPKARKKKLPRSA